MRSMSAVRTVNVSASAMPALSQQTLPTTPHAKIACSGEIDMVTYHYRERQHRLHDWLQRRATADQIVCYALVVAGICGVFVLLLT